MKTSTNASNPNDLHNVKNSREEENSPIKRKRLTLACTQCRKKKVKCDGAKSGCGNCSRLSIECTYIASNKKRGPRQGYIELLERRLDQMEKLLQPLAATTPTDDDEEEEEEEEEEVIDQSISQAEYNDSVNSNSSGSSPAVARRKPESTKLGSSASGGYPKDQGLNEKYEALEKARASNPSSENSSEHEFISSENSYFGVSSVMAVAPYGVFRSRESIFAPPINNNELITDNEDLPPRDIIEHLISVYFSHIFQLAPIFHQPTFEKNVRLGLVPRILLLAVFAVSARHSVHPDVVGNPAWSAGEKYATKARLLISNSFDVPMLSNVQALILLSLHEFGSARGPRAWMYGGMAIRMAQEIGLNKEDSLQTLNPQSPFRCDAIEQETRRRTFWTCFMIDKFASVATGRAQTIDERDCEVFLPSDLHDWKSDGALSEMLDGSKPEISSSSLFSPFPIFTTVSQYGYFLQIVSILGRVTHYVNRPKPKNALPQCDSNSEFMLLDQALINWTNSLPPNLQATEENLNKYLSEIRWTLFFLMHALKHGIIVLLHRPNLAISEMAACTQEMMIPWYREFIEQSTKKCLDSANAVTEILKFGLGKKAFTVTPFIGYVIYTSATIHINNSFNLNPIIAQSAKAALAIHYSALQELSPYWAMADKLYFTMRDLYELHSKSATEHASSDPSSTGVNDVFNFCKPSDIIPLWSNNRPSIPMRPDSAFVALWQMAMIQQQQQQQQQQQSSRPDSANSVLTSVSPSSSSLAAPISLQPNSLSGLSDFRPPVTEPGLESSWTNTSTALPTSSSSFITNPVRPSNLTPSIIGYNAIMDDYFGQDVSGYNFILDNRLFTTMTFSRSPQDQPLSSSTLYQPLVTVTSPSTTKKSAEGDIEPASNMEGIITERLSERQ